MRIKVGRSAVRLDKKDNVQFIVDWDKTKKLWKTQYPDLTATEISLIKNKELVYILNEHTEGKVIHWHWEKYRCNIKNKSAYRIKLNRKWTLMLKDKIKSSKKIEYYG